MTIKIIKICLLFFLSIPSLAQYESLMIGNFRNSQWYEDQNAPLDIMRYSPDEQFTGLKNIATFSLGQGAGDDLGHDFSNAAGIFRFVTAAYSNQPITRSAIGFSTFGKYSGGGVLKFYVNKIPNWETDAQGSLGLKEVMQINGYGQTILGENRSELSTFWRSDGAKLNVIRKPIDELEDFDKPTSISNFIIGKDGDGELNPNAEGRINFGTQRATNDPLVRASIGFSAYGDNQTGGNLMFYTSQGGVLVEGLALNGIGQVAIGGPFANSNYILSVGGLIKAEGLSIDLINDQNQWPDYVFKEQYNLPSLDSIKSFINENKHLPNFPPASDIEEQGFEVANILISQMKTIEELTLHVIQLNEKLIKLESKLKTEGNNE